jgi:hypothetical protein
VLLFIDESGFDESGTPCEVLAGVAIAEDSLWNLVRAVRGAEKELFGDYLRNPTWTTCAATPKRAALCHGRKK